MNSTSYVKIYFPSEYDSNYSTILDGTCISACDLSHLVSRVVFQKSKDGYRLITSVPGIDVAVLVFEATNN